MRKIRYLYFKNNRIFNDMVSFELTLSFLLFKHYKSKLGNVLKKFICQQIEVSKD